MASAVAKGREDLIVNTLRDSTLSLPAYLAKAFEFPEVSEIEVWKLTPGSWDGALKDHLRPGFDPDSAEVFLLEKHKPGRFVLKPIIGGMQRAPKTFSLGDFEDPAPSAAAARNGHAESDLDPGQVLRNFAAELREDLGLGRLTELKDAQEQKRLMRDLMPMQIMAEIAKSMRPAPTGNNDRVVDLVISTLKDSRDSAERREQLLMEELRAIRTQAAASATATKPVDTLQQLRDNIKLASELGIVGKAVGAGWTPEAVNTVLEKGVAPVLSSPLFQALADAVRTRLSGGVIAPAAPGPASPALTPGGTMTTPNRELSPEVRDAISLVVEALRSRDFATVLWMTESVFVNPDGSPTFRIDPDVNVSAYIFALRKLDPAFDGLRAEFADFLKFVGQKRNGGDTAA